jgi:hypothetical protein
VTTAYGFLGADTLDKGESANASNRDTYVADPLQCTGIELVLIKYRRENIDHIYIDNPLTNKGCLKRNLFTLLSI